MLPADRTLQEISAALRDAQRRIERLETLETPTFGAIACLETKTPDGVSSVTFSAINQDFLHLWLWIIAKDPTITPGGTMRMTFNGDTAANYAYLNKFQLKSNGTATESVAGGTSAANALFLSGNGDSAYWGSCEVNIYNYTLLDGKPTQRTITWKSWSGFEAGGEIGSLVVIGRGGGKWVNTIDPITSITVSAGGGSFTFADGSLLSLMGVCAI